MLLVYDRVCCSPNKSLANSVVSIYSFDFHMLRCTLSSREQADNDLIFAPPTEMRTEMSRLANLRHIGIPRKLPAGQRSQTSPQH